VRGIDTEEGRKKQSEEEERGEGRFKHRERWRRERRGKI
jgi:hypothetical protein